MTMKPNKQITGNVGMYYACFQLSKLGLNVLPTSRNARGADIIVYNEEQTKFSTVQVKAMTKLTNISLGKSTDLVQCDWWVVVMNVYEQPFAHVLTRSEVIDSAKLYSDCHWAQGKALATSHTLNAWERISECLVT
ncbi:hypothetical protein [Rhodopirellula baltica]|nr:hypothetical protein [Rhodopirellula baltica]